MPAGVECGDWSFYEDLRAHAAADADERDPLEPDARALFEALEDRFKADQVITISPGELASCMEAGPDGAGPTAPTLGKLLKRYGFAERHKRTKRRSEYLISRELFEEQARRHRYRVGSATETRH